MIKKIIISIVSIIILFGIYIYYILYINPASPFDKVNFKNSDLEINIEYSRPYKKDRLIFGNESEGALVPYDKYWRLGANNASQIEISRDITFADKSLPKGKYRIYAIPGNLEWIVRLNSEIGKFGFNEPNYNKDVLEVKLSPQPLLNSLEQFTIEVIDNENGISIQLKWDKTLITIPIK